MCRLSCIGSTIRSRKDGGAEKVGRRKKGRFGCNPSPIQRYTHRRNTLYDICPGYRFCLLGRETTQTLILVGIVPAGQFHAEARAIPLNYFLLLVGVMLSCLLCAALRKASNELDSIQRLTPITVTVLLMSLFLGIALLTFGLASVITYQNMEQHLDGQLERVSEDIRKRVRHNVDQDLRQLAAFDRFCNTKGSECKATLEKDEPGNLHWAQRLCLGMREEGGREGRNRVNFLFGCVRPVRER